MKRLVCMLAALLALVTPALAYDAPQVRTTNTGNDSIGDVAPGLGGATISWRQCNWSSAACRALPSFINSVPIANLTGVGARSNIFSGVAPQTTQNPTNFFGTYDQKGLEALYFTNSENLSAFPAGSFRDGFYISHQVTDATDYGPTIQHVNNGIRVNLTSAFNATTGAYGVINQDQVGGEFDVVGKTMEAARGTSGMNASVTQYGLGIADNEDSVRQPAASEGSIAQSMSIAGRQIFIAPRYADADTTHTAYGLMVGDTGGKRGTAALFIYTAPDGVSPLVYPAHWNNGIDMSAAIVDNAAIVMPQSGANNTGTVIDYGGNNFSSYDRTNNRFNWTIGGTAAGQFTATGLNSTAVGATTPAAGNFTTLAASTPLGLASGGTGNNQVAWTVYSPTITTSTGTGVTFTNVVAAYFLYGKTLFLKCQFQVNYTTAPSGIVIPLPAGMTANGVTPILAINQQTFVPLGALSNNSTSISVLGPSAGPTVTATGQVVAINGPMNIQ